MKGALTLHINSLFKDLRFSFRYLMKDKRRLLLAFLVFVIIPLVNVSWKLVDPSIEVPYYENLQVLVWTLSETACMVLTSTAWYLSAGRKDYVIKFISLGSVYYWVFTFLPKVPFGKSTTLLEEILIFICCITIFTFLLNYIRNNYIYKNTNYKEEYDGMVYDYHHLCRGFTKTVEGLNHLKKKGYITDEEYGIRLSSTTERFDEFAMKIHDRYQELV